MSKLIVTIVSAGILALALNCTNAVSTPYCVTVMDSAVSSTFSSNFNCVQVSVSGANHVFKSNNLPNYKSYYYGSSSELYEALPSGNTAAGTNKISSQNLSYTIPTTGTLMTGTLSGTQAGLVSIGVSVNGLAIFNNAAAPPDTLAVEALTFDNYGGHPQNSGVYHYHAQPTYVSNNDAKLIGVALDGYLIYGKKCDGGTSSTADDFQPTASVTTASSTYSATGDTATSLDFLHGHTAKTQHLTTATYHYHLALDPVATIDTLMAGFFRGVKGSVSN